MAKLSARHAAIAQPVERILGKDEVASSNLASSSKRTPNLSGCGVLFLVSSGTGDLIPCPKGRFNHEVVRLQGGSADLDRVASSNLASSSIKNPKPFGFGFLFT